MRISDLHIVDVTMLFASESGGVRRYLTEKRNWLQRQPGVRHSFLLPRLGGSPAPEQSIALDSVRIPFSNGYRMPLSMADAARRLGALAPDVIEVGDPYTLAWSALKVAREDGVPAVAFCHTDLPAVSSMWFGRAGGRIAEIYFKRLYRHFDLVLAPSRAVTSQLLDLGVKRVAHQPLGVDPAIFSPRRRPADLRRFLGLSRRTRLLAYSGRFDREKNIRVLIEAVKRLGNPYHLVCIGAGSEFVNGDRVSVVPFIGSISRLAAAICGCDVFVHAGDRETFGLSILEAMACGKPVVAVRAGAVPELIPPGGGVLVEPNAADQFAAAVVAVFDAGIDEMGRAARAHVVERYAWDQVLPPMLSRYRAMAVAAAAKSYAEPAAAFRRRIPSIDYAPGVGEQSARRH